MRSNHPPPHIQKNDINTHVLLQIFKANFAKIAQTSRTGRGIKDSFADIEGPSGDTNYYDGYGRLFCETCG